MTVTAHDYPYKVHEIPPEKRQTTWHSKEELFAEIKKLEDQTFALINDDNNQDEFDRVTDRVVELMGIAREMGWIA